MTASATRTSVLIVEDEGIIARNLQELLVSQGYDAFAVASTSEEAVARASDRCPDVVLMDIRLKGKIDGIETAKLLKARFDIPIIYLTAHADETTLDRAKKTEPFGYLVKPVKPAELRSAIEVAGYKHAMERELRERERWFSTTVRSIDDAVITSDLAGNITFMNPAAELLLGVTLDATLGHPAREVLRLQDAEWPEGETPLDRAMRERRPVYLSDAVLRDRGGPGRVIADSAAPVIDQDVVIGAVMVIRDVTEQRLLRHRLEIADRLASLGTMAAGVAHEINNPLAVVISNGEFVLEQLRRAPSPLTPGSLGAEASPVDTSEAISAQQDVMSAANRIARIVSDLQAFSRPVPKGSGSLDVRNAIEWSIRSTAHELRHRARVSTRFQNVPRIDGDETRLSQVLVNLLINAAHAIAPGNVEGNEVSVTALSDEQGRAIIEVTDTGGGIPSEALGRVFEPFFTTKPIGLGTGLGLSICHGLVASMGGTLSVESRVGKGTTFRLTLPASAGQAPSASSRPSTRLDGAARRGRLLLIDDEQMILSVLARILAEHETVCTTDAAEALVRLENDDAFDIIVCDLMMPNMTGIEFYEQLLRLRPELARRVVFMTGGAMTASGAGFLDAVPNQRLEKPFGVQTLRNTIQGILAANSAHGASAEN